MREAAHGHGMRIHSSDNCDNFMNKKRLLLFLWCLSAAFSALADEGMWLPSLIGRQVDDMKAKGFRLTAEDIYSVNQASLKDAVVLLEKLWDIDERFVDEHTLTTSISRIRSKIESDGGAPYIKTVYGMGYQWTGGEAK